MGYELWLIYLPSESMLQSIIFAYYMWMFCYVIMWNTLLEVNNTNLLG
jgi:hypothetical protein